MKFVPNIKYKFAILRNGGNGNKVLFSKNSFPKPTMILYDKQYM